MQGHGRKYVAEVVGSTWSEAFSSLSEVSTGRLNQSSLPTMFDPRMNRISFRKSGIVVQWQGRGKGAFASCVIL